MNISNTKRTSKSTEGKNVTFTCDGYYLVPPFTKDELECLFENVHNDAKAVIIFTDVVHDKGVHYPEESFYGVPFDNGLVGYQQRDYFNNLEEAKTAFELRLKTTSYKKQFCDMFLIVKQDWSDLENNTSKKMKLPLVSNLGIINNI